MTVQGNTTVQTDTTVGSDTKPNGPAAAAFLAAGIGCFVLGVFTTLAEASTQVADALKLVKDVGPLSGKVIIAVLAMAISWIVAYLALRGKEVKFGQFFAAALILVALGFLLTFPPFFDLFAPKA
jgi:hypothetical protein